MEVDPERPVLVDKYLDRADELDVDALCDKDGNVTICGIMQHIEQAGVHSGAPSLWPPPLPDELSRQATRPRMFTGEGLHDQLQPLHTLGQCHSSAAGLRN